MTTRAAPRRALAPALAALLALLLFVIAGFVWYGGSILATTALLEGSRATQRFFITVLATFQWSGSSILLMIGAGLVLCSLIQALLWPRGYLWRRAAPLWRGVFAALWGLAALAESAVMAWGASLWGLGAYSLVFPAAPIAGLFILAALVGPLVALLPEWLARRGGGLIAAAWNTGLDEGPGG